MNETRRSPWLRDDRGGVMVWAHRGGGFEQPSSTRRAMESTDVDGLELDLQATADLESGSDDGVVGFHDDFLDNTTDGSGPVSKMTYSELARLDPAYWWVPGAIFDHNAKDYPLRGRHRTDDDLRIMRLVDILEAEPDRPLSLDLKSPGMAGKVAELLQRFGRVDDVVVASFSERRVQQLRHRLPKALTAPGYVGASLFFAGSRFQKPLNPLGHTVLAPPHRMGPLSIDRRFVETAHEAGLSVHVWTVNDLRVLDRMLSIGVDAVITDVPSKVQPIVSRFNASL